MPEIGQRFGRLVLLERTDERWRKNIVGLWLCDCGTEKRLPMSRASSGLAKSCGCLKIKHGDVGSDEYRAWGAMRSRCSAKSGDDFECYAARGIGICERWESFSNFLGDMGRKPTKAHSLGRINNDLGYSPENCRWETPAQQMQNTRNARTWVIKGETFPTCRSAAAHFGVDHATVRYWVKTRSDCHAVPKY